MARNLQQNLGQQGEALAAQWLTKNLEFKIIDRNWRSGSFAELDLVAIDESRPERVLVAVEVKTRESQSRGRGIESITPKKLYTLKRSFLFFKKANPKTPDLMRIDAVDVLFDKSGDTDIKYYRGIT